MPIPHPADSPPPEPGISEPARMGMDPIARLLATPTGTRVVVRCRIVSGFTDTLGELSSCNGTVAVIDTRSGPQQVIVAHVVAMRVVPPPPPRRPRPLPV